MFVVEDKGAAAEQFYEVLLGSVLHGVDLEFEVCGLGGKQLVLARLEYNSTGQDAEFYLVDGDFDELSGSPIVTDLALYRFEHYDVESYLMESTAICEVAVQQNPGRRFEEYRCLLDLETWKEVVIEACLRLVATLVLLGKLDVEAGFESVAQFVEGNDIVPSRDKMESFIHAKRIEQQVITASEFDGKIDALVECIDSSVQSRGQMDLWQKNMVTVVVENVSAAWVR